MSNKVQKKEENDSKKVKAQIEETVELLRMQAIQKSKQGLEFASFTEKQTDKSLDLIELNEKNAFKFHTQKLNALKEIELARINASIVDQTNLKWIIIGLLIVIPIMTGLILIFKEDYFIPWLTFLTGAFGGGFGGFGIGRTVERKKSELNQEVEIDDKI